MSRCWIAVLEDDQGMWNSDPIGAFSQEELLKLCEADSISIPWHKRYVNLITNGRNPKEALVIYECFERFTFESPEEFKEFLETKALKDKAENKLVASILSSAANSGAVRTSHGLAIWIAAIGDFDLDYLS